jgi:hypothetical protein
LYPCLGFAFFEKSIERTFRKQKDFPIFPEGIRIPPGRASFVIAVEAAPFSQSIISLERQRFFFCFFCFFCFLTPCKRKILVVFKQNIKNFLPKVTKLCNLT